MMWCGILLLKAVSSGRLSPVTEILVWKIQTAGSHDVDPCPSVPSPHSISNKNNFFKRHLLTRCGMLYVISVNTYLAVSVPSKILSSANTSFIGLRSSRTGGIFNSALAASTAFLVA